MGGGADQDHFGKPERGQQNGPLGTLASSTRFPVKLSGASFFDDPPTAVKTQSHTEALTGCRPLSGNRSARQAAAVKSHSQTLRP